MRRVAYYLSIHFFSVNFYLIIVLIKKKKNSFFISNYNYTTIRKTKFTKSVPFEAHGEYVIIENNLYV